MFQIAQGVVRFTKGLVRFTQSEQNIYPPHIKNYHAAVISVEVYPERCKTLTKDALQGFTTVRCSTQTEVLPEVV